MIKKLTLDRIDTYFILILTINIIIKIFIFPSTPVFIDSYTYIFAAQNIIDLNYINYRAPFFPLLIVPFILLTGDAFFSIKLTSFITGIGLIILSYIIFSKAAMKVFTNCVFDTKLKGKYVGFLVSFFITFNLYFLFHDLKGLREQLLAILVICIFFYSIVKETKSLKDNIFLALLISFLTLSLLTAGLFITLGVIFFFLFSKLKWFKFKPIKSKEVFMILLSFIFTFLFWAFFNLCKSLPPFYSLDVQSFWFKFEYGLEIESFGDIIDLILNALVFGFPSALIYLISLIGISFVLVVFILLIKNFKKKQFFFLFFYVGTNFAYLSIFITTPRVIMYFFPFFFYIISIPLSALLINMQKKEIRKKKRKQILYIFLTFLISYTLKGLDSFSIIYLILQIYRGAALSINFEKVLLQYSEPFSPFGAFVSIIFFIINEISLIILLLKTRDLNISDELNFLKQNLSLKGY